MNNVGTSRWDDFITGCRERHPLRFYIISSASGCINASPTASNRVCRGRYYLPVLAPSSE
ncbi:MAG: hypothetical protein IJF58_04920 [Clostridia bacterium]|nr:hypothetical protein [Clostridia bacterium]